MGEGIGIGGVILLVGIFFAIALAPEKSAEMVLLFIGGAGAFIGAIKLGLLL